MAKIPIAKVLELVNVSRSTLYRDLAENKRLADTDATGRKVIDPAELERVYGRLLTPHPNGTAGTSETPYSDKTGQHGTPPPKPSLRQTLSSPFWNNRLSPCSPN